MLSEIEPRTHVGFTSYSGLTLHRTCPQAWSYRQLWRLEKPPEDDPAVPLKFGTWWHALRAADAIDRGRAKGSLKYAPKTIRCADGPASAPGSQGVLGGDLGGEYAPGPVEIPTRTENDGEPIENLAAKVLEKAEQWERQLDDEAAEQWRSKIGALPSQALRSSDHRWREAQAEDLEFEEPIGVEVKWTRDLPGKEGEQPTTLIGYTDEVYRDGKRGMIVVRDVKTAGSLGTQTAADDMLNSQLNLNAWGLRDRLAEWGVPAAQAIAFDRMCSAQPTKPKLTKAGRLSKTVSRYDLATYREFCESDEAKEAGYEPEPAIIEKLSTPAAKSIWFQRTLTPMNRNIAKAHLQAAVDTLGDSKRTVDRVRRRGEAPRNMTGSACRWCQFAKLCRAQMLGGPDGEYQIEEYGLRAMGRR